MKAFFVIWDKANTGGAHVAAGASLHSTELQYEMYATQVRDLVPGCPVLSVEVPDDFVFLFRATPSFFSCESRTLAEVVDKARLFMQEFTPSWEAIRSELKKEEPKPESAIVYLDTWTESELGWGQRPDGFSVHLSEDIYKEYVKKYWENMPKRTPNEYSFPNEQLTQKKVPYALYEHLVSNNGSLRSYRPFDQYLKDEFS